MYVLQAPRLSHLPSFSGVSRERLRPLLLSFWVSSSSVLESSSSSCLNQPRTYQMQQYLQAILIKFEQLPNRSSPRLSQRQPPSVARLPLSEDSQSQDRRWKWRRQKDCMRRSFEILNRLERMNM